MPGHHGAKRVAGDLPDHHHQRDAGDRHDVLPQQRRVNKQTDRYEKHRREKVAHRLDQRLDPPALRRLRHHRADEERSQRHAETQLGRDQRRAKTKPQHGDQQPLVALETGDKIEQTRYDQQPDHQHGHEEHQQFAGGGGHRLQAKVAGGRDAGEQHDHHHAEQILDDQNAVNQPGERLAVALHFAQHFYDHRR